MPKISFNSRLREEATAKTETGSKLLKTAEEETVRRGFHSVHVDTMNWQIPESKKSKDVDYWGT